jgi:hypothetical protein
VVVARKAARALDLEAVVEDLDADVISPDAVGAMRDRVDDRLEPGELRDQRRRSEPSSGLEAHDRREPAPRPAQMGRSADKETGLSEQRKYRSWTAKQKIEIVLAGLRGDRSVKEVCREHAISETLYYSWREKLLEGGRDETESLI